MYNVDLHFHSPYSAACSKKTTMPLISEQSKIKGLNLVTTSDILNEKWFEHVKKNIVKENDCFVYKEDINKKNKTYFIHGTEVECKQRVHNLLYFKDFEHVLSFKKIIKKYSKDIDSSLGGRPRLSLTCEELLNICIEENVLLCPAHIFTPYFGVYAHYDSLKDAFGKNYKKIKCIELGLSADTSTGNIIPELKDVMFFSFSDSHSTNSYRLGREFVSMELKKPNYDNLKMLVEGKKNKLVYNSGYNPLEGKYNKTACRKCGQIYNLEQAKALLFKCSVCKNTLKKGVSDRAIEIAKQQGNDNLFQLKERAPYIHALPLIQIIELALNKKINKKVLEMYEMFIKENNEIDVLLNVEEKKLKEINENIAKYILAFRNGSVVYKPGGAGFYGKPFVCFSKEEMEKKQKEINESINKNKIIQKKLF